MIFHLGKFRSKSLSNCLASHRSKVLRPFIWEMVGWDPTGTHQTNTQLRLTGNGWLIIQPPEPRTLLPQRSTPPPASIKGPSRATPRFQPVLFFKPQISGFAVFQSYLRFVSTKKHFWFDKNLVLPKKSRWFLMISSFALKLSLSKKNKKVLSISQVWQQSCTYTTPPFETVEEKKKTQLMKNSPKN